MATKKKEPTQKEMLAAMQRELKNVSASLDTLRIGATSQRRMLEQLQEMVAGLDIDMRTQRMGLLMRARMQLGRMRPLNYKIGLLLGVAVGAVFGAWWLGLF